MPLCVHRLDRLAVLAGTPPPGRQDERLLRLPAGAFARLKRGPWQKFTQQAGSSASDEVIENALTRLGWLSPYFCACCWTKPCAAARERQQENPTPADRDMLILSDVHDAYEKLLANRSRFYHWELRLKPHYPPANWHCARTCSNTFHATPTALTLRQLHSRLSKHEADAERRTQRLQDLLVRLSDEGYLSPPSASQRVQFLSFSAARLVEPQPCLKHFSPMFWLAALPPSANTIRTCGAPSNCAPSLWPDNTS